MRAEGTHSEDGEAEPNPGDEPQDAPTEQDGDARTDDGDEHVEGDEESVHHPAREVGGDGGEHEGHDADRKH